MGYLRALVCDGCGKTLTLPTRRSTADTWERLDRSWYDRFGQLRHTTRFWCGQCSERQGIVEQLEALC